MLEILNYIEKYPKGNKELDTAIYYLNLAIAVSKRSTI